MVGQAQVLPGSRSGSTFMIRGLCLPCYDPSLPPLSAHALRLMPMHLERGSRPSCPSGSTSLATPSRESLALLGCFGASIRRLHREPLRSGGAWQPSVLQLPRTEGLTVDNGVPLAAASDRRRSFFTASRSPSAAPAPPAPAHRSVMPHGAGRW